MSGGTHGGRYAVLNGISAVRNWQINENGTLSKFVNSATAIGAGRKAGTTSWAGGYSAHGGLPSVLPGILFGFTGYTAPDDDIFSHAGMSYSGNAMSESASINWDWASGNVLEHQVNFAGHLGLTANIGAYPPVDAGVSNPEPVGVCHIDSSPDGTTWTRIPNVTQASLQLVNSVQPYINADTATTTGRKAGPFDWTASIAVEDSLLGSGLAQFGTYQFRFYTTASLFWLLKWGTVKESTGLTSNAETGAIISHSISLEMNGAVGGVLGSVIAPGAMSSYWGT